MTISVAGGQANGMSYIMDGGTHNDPFNNLNLPTPFPDAMQEFKVETSALPARYGHHAASAVNVVTKSGTNKFTAAPSSFLRNYRFNARNAFAPARDSLKRNQFGGTLGGPIVKNKAVLLRRLPGTHRAQQPGHGAQLRADAGHAERRLHRLRLARLQRRPPGRPARRRSSTTASTPSRLNTVAAELPRSTFPSPADPCGRLRYGIPNNNNEHQGLGKLDYTINQQQSAFARYFYRRLRQPRDLRRRERA